MFDITVGGRSATPGDCLPDWTIRDRLGVVVREPWGALGASLLMQASALLHYQVRPIRRTTAAQYPQIYVFHVGRMHGDHSSFDVWPPRHEIRVDDDPAGLLGAINDLAITRLALPDRNERNLDFLHSALTGWSDEAVVRENLASAWAYSADGHVGSSDIRMRSSAPELERMSTWALDPQATYQRYSPLSDTQLVEEMQLGPSTASDLRRWLETLSGRIGETSARARAEVGQRRGQMVESRTQTYRRLSVDEMLRLL
ncbi:hypothetical protein O4328_41310 [Rhodococcus opacus]|uniref:Uncharacterized protein n=1 Tax=Rhodococcus opacus TaxID=37919 RepID=A0AAX3Y5D2_RHOOP|nr:hypothetical protein [Rhodococcus opacus]MCZ4590000.1 hypothetical protein [Rhodococcus opacus]WLF44525.1 hypothetical protein Q5707_21455 [Rhodococcus opacus]